MRVSREQAAENRKRVVDVAGRLFRENGFDGIGVADLMKEAGLTHGGFYGQFASKEDLAAEALATALARSAERWRERAAKAGGDGFDALVSFYLSRRHAADLPKGCPISALAGDAVRSGDAVKHSFTEGLRSLLDILAANAPGEDATERRSRALATFSGMVGATLLARAVDDPSLSDEILEAARAALAP